ncbi:MAG: bifunctional diguanylate cyclase/phosphodiesterase, partial [Gammaproteobacteria bacterium]|nr:bifunctional diguanylate cyclase/phosphodiesterase [Gammaproteobacteria bacterium]
ARLGGDEFTIVLEDLKHAEDAAIVAEKILEGLSHTIDLGGHEIIPGASIGISIFPEDGGDNECIIKNADIAMYQAKQKGRNRYQFYTQEFSQHADLKFHMEKSLRHALENNELEVYYQPQVNLKNGVIAGAEALVRWNSPEKGLLSPAEFLPFAEENGLIEPIGVWVLETACTQAKAWQDQGMTPVRMSVNISGYQITHGFIVESTKAALKKSGLSAEFLELEITEDFVMGHLDKSVEKLNALQELGVSLAIDDFGTGYSSLAYLKRFPIDIIKIDQSFVRDIHSDPSDAAICEAILAIAHRLDLDVVAEGVETESQFNFLSASQCHTVQGNLFGQPEPLENIIHI